MQTKRNANVEILRLLAMGMIVCMHFYTHSGIWGEIDYGSTTYHASHFLMSLCRVAVDVFALITGMFMVNKKFSSKRLVSVWMMVSFYSVVLCIVYIIATGNVNTTMIIRSILPVSTKMYWFISVYFFVMVFHPFLNAMLNRLDDRQWRVLIGISFAVCCLLYFVYPKADLVQLESGYSLIWFIFLYITGGYIGTHEFKKRPYFLFYLLTCLAAFGGETLVAVLVNDGMKVLGDYKVIFTAYNSPFVFIASVFLILAFRTAKQYDVSIVRFVGSLGRYSIGIYLIHEYPYLRDLLWKKLFTPAEYEDGSKLFLVLYLAFCIAVIMIAGLLVEFLRSKLAGLIMKIPMLNKLMDKADSFMLKEGN